MIVDEKDGSESASDSEVIVPVHDDHQSLHDHDNQGQDFDGCPFVTKKGSPASPTGSQDLHRGYQHQWT